MMPGAQVTEVKGLSSGIVGDLRELFQYLRAIPSETIRELKTTRLNHGEMRCLVLVVAWFAIHAMVLIPIAYLLVKFVEFICPG